MPVRTTSVKSIMDAIVPISRFNRGEANKIFEEVSEYGCKIVLKNNTPACVLLQPERYEAMVQALEDYALFFEAEKRMESAIKDGFIRSDKVLEDLGISREELEDTEVEIE